VGDRSSGEVFCYFGLLRSREELDRIVAMLPDTRRDAALALIRDCDRVPDSELRKRLATVRQAQAEEFRRRVALPQGASLEGLSQVLRWWLESKVGNGNGPEDYQSQARS
jgi:hypothetical protein